MYIEAVPNRNSPPAVLLRESYREAGKVKKRTLANLSKWPPALVDGLKTLLEGGTAVAHLAQTVDIVRSLPHGHVAAVLALMRSVRFERLLDPSPERDRALALIAARLLDPASKLATARGLDPETARDHRAAHRVRAHVWLCLLAYCVEWHLRDRLKALLFDDEVPGGAPRPSVVAPAHVSDSAKEKAHSKRTAAGWPVHSLRTLLDDLATLVKSQVVPRLPNAEPFELLTRPTALQREVFQLLGVRLEGTE